MPDKTQQSHQRPHRVSRLREFWLLLAFMGVYALLDYIYFIIPDDIFIHVIHAHGLVAVCADLINVITPFERVVATTNQLLSAKVELNIVRGCDGAGVFFVLIAAMTIFPAPWQRKLIGIAQGIALIYAVNVLRICALYYIQANLRSWFVLVHIYVAPTFMLLIGCIFFAWWAFNSTRPRHDPA
jgi:exosortase family protein XrtM